MNVNRLRKTIEELGSCDRLRVRRPDGGVLPLSVRMSVSQEGLTLVVSWLWMSSDGFHPLLLIGLFAEVSKLSR